MSSNNVASLKRHLDRLLDGVDADWESEQVGGQVIRDAIVRFKSAGPEMLELATNALWAYYESEVAEMENIGWSGFKLPELTERSEIWDYVSVGHPPTIVLGGGPLAPALVYISFEGEVPWEPEHGLNLVIEDGQRIGKLGPFDGHVTNARAYNDESLLGVVFFGIGGRTAL